MIPVVVVLSLEATGNALSIQWSYLNSYCIVLSSTVATPLSHLLLDARARAQTSRDFRSVARALYSVSAAKTPRRAQPRPMDVPSTRLPTIA